MFMNIEELNKKLDMLNLKREEIGYDLLSADKNNVITLEDQLDEVEQEIEQVRREIYIKRRSLKGRF